MTSFDAALFLIFIAIPMLVALAIPSPRRARNVFAAPFYGLAILWVLMSFGFLGNEELMSAVQRLNNVTSGFGGWALVLAIATIPPFFMIILANLIRGRLNSSKKDTADSVH